MLMCFLTFPFLRIFLVCFADNNYTCNLSHGQDLKPQEQDTLSYPIPVHSCATTRPPSSSIAIITPTLSPRLDLPGFSQILTWHRNEKRSSAIADLIWYSAGE